MSGIDLKNEKALSKRKRRKNPMGYQAPTRKEIETALDEFLSKGGKITRVEPLWIEEGTLYMFD